MPRTAAAFAISMTWPRTPAQKNLATPHPSVKAQSTQIVGIPIGIEM